MREGGKTVAQYVYDATGTRVLSVDRTGRRAITRHDVTSTLEWDETRAMVWTHVRLGGRAIATLSDPLGTPVNTPGGTLASAPLAAPSLRSGPRLAPGTAGAIVFAPAALLALGLLLELERRRQKGLPLTKSVLASTTLVAFFIAMSSEAHASGAALSGDLNGDARLDAGDALIATLIARGARTPTASELSAGDVAPLNVAPTSPSAINAADLLLIERALRGEDVDGDTLSTTSELTNGTSPFRADTDRDGLRDDVELAYGTHPAQSDADGDGLTDAAEIAAGSDPEDRDTDGDGYLDGIDTDPRGGVVYRHGDHLGSTTLTTRSDAQVIARAVYRPFGGVVPASAGSPTHAPGEFGFTGQRYEKASGIYDYGARFYDPALGRFLTPDTVVPGGGLDPQGLNRYAYVRNNPMSYVDPSGMFWQELWGGITTSTSWVVNQVSGFGSGFGGSIQHSFGFGGGSSGSGPGYALGAWLGGAVGISGGLAAGALSVPFLSAGDLLGSLPGIGSHLAAPFNTVGNAIYGYGARSAVRGDSFSKSNWTPLSPFTTDAGATGFGAIGQAVGIVQAAGTTLKGTLGFDADARGDIASSWLSAAVPRHGIFSGPDHPRSSLYDPNHGTFNTGADIGARSHDRRYREGSKYQNAADWGLVHYLEGGNLPIPGPVSGVYQVLMLEAFRVKAQNGWTFE